MANGFGSGPGKVAGIGGGFAYDSAYYLRLNGRFGNQEGSIHIFLNNVPAYKNQGLHNGRGQVVQTGNTRDGLVRLNTAELPAGLYHVVGQRGRQVIRRNLSVRH